MEFSPSYRNDYFPDTNSPYWFRDRETMDPEKRDELIVARIREVMAYAYDHSPFYQRKWDEAGIKANDIRTLADFEEVPVVTKQELRDSQAEKSTFRGLPLLSRKRHPSYSRHFWYHRPTHRFWHFQA